MADGNNELPAVHVGPFSFLDDWAYSLATKMVLDQTEPSPELVSRVKVGIIMGGAGAAGLGLFLLLRAARR